MGTGIGVSCKECDYEEELYIGYGMISHLIDIDALINESTGEELETLKNLRDNFSAKINGYVCNKLYECSKCMTLHSLEYYELILNNNQLYKKQNICPICNEPLKALPDDLEIDLKKYRCPKCGKKSLNEFLGVIMWD